MPTKQDQDEDFEDQFFAITGESSKTVLAYARTITDPWAYLKEVVKETSFLSEHFQVQYEDFVLSTEEFLAEVDASLETKRNLNENEDHWHSVYDPNAETRFLRYNPREMVRDIWGIDPTFFAVDSARSKRTRAEWKRVTKDQPNSLRLLTEYGNFDIGVTEKSARAALRVRTQVRKGEPFLSVGAVQISLLSGKVWCGVYGCNHSGRLSNRPSPVDPNKPDREWQEYQILRIIEHLGTHDRKGSWKAFPVFQEPTKRFRDSDSDKLLDHYMRCNNPACKH